MVDHIGNVEAAPGAAPEEPAANERLRAALAPVNRARLRKIS